MLLIGAIRAKPASKLVYYGAMGVIAAAGIAVFQEPSETQVVFGGLFTVDALSDYLKILLLLGSFATLAMSKSYVWRVLEGKFEYPLLILTATLGACVMASASDLLTLYVGLELQSLSLYVLAAFRRDHATSSEAGLKYFILGALSSGALLYGASLIYGFVGTTNFAQLGAALHDSAYLTPPVIVGMVFVLAGLAFKISAAPFHMWTPDVYAGAPTSVTAFFAAVPKIAAMALLLRVLAGPFSGTSGAWMLIMQIMALLSMAVGAFAALKQRDLKRLLAYSSIGHVGYMLVGLAAGGEKAFLGVLVYLAIYLFMTLGIFAVLLGLKRGEESIERIEDLAGLGQSQPLVALCVAALMFSLAGVPPLAGFFGKLYVFVAAVEAGYYPLAIAGVLLSAVSAFYYLRIIKVMYFEAVPADRMPLQPLRDYGAMAVVAISTLYLVLFAFMPSLLIDSAAKIAHGLFQ